ncbi:MAG: Fic family protein [Nitriliruptorales bacterium]|nr:Fic family protein [Nitriliruptorales bacterium]
MRFTRSSHLTALIADSERLASRLARLELDRGADRVDDLLASLRLDGSTIPAAGWQGAIRTRSDLDAADETIWEAEQAGLAAASQDLVAVGKALREDPTPTLARLHTQITEGLVAADRRGQWRLDERTVTDASVGRIIYWPTRPAEIGLAMAGLAAWVVGPGSREHPLVRSGWTLLHLLHIQPFDAANGRVARLAARALLADGRLDPHHVAPLNQIQEADAIGLFEEVAKTVRRRDATVWLERWGEVVTTALRRALATHAEPEPPDEAAVAAVEALPDRFTITDWRERAGTGSDEGLRQLLDAGRVAPVPGTRGLRFVRTN